MKKILIIISLVLTFTLVGCGTQKSYKEIDYATYKDMIKEEQSFILFIGSSDCSHCVEFKTTLEQVLKKYDVEINYIDLSLLTTEELNEFKSQISFTGTPTTIFIEKGEEKSHYNRIVGAQSYDKVIDKLADNGYIEVK